MGEHTVLLDSWKVVPLLPVFETTDNDVMTEQPASTWTVKRGLADDTDQWQAFVIAVMNLFGPQQQAIR
jgi:hypothetical protein